VLELKTTCPSTKVQLHPPPLWHTSLTKDQTKSLEDIQHRALQIIIGNIPYEGACCMLKLPPLSDRRRSLCTTLFKQTVSRESHVLHYLLPAKRDAEVTSRLRSMNKYPTIRTRTNRYKNSFILYGLANFQCHLQS